MRRDILSRLESLEEAAAIRANPALRPRRIVLVPGKGRNEPERLPVLGWSSKFGAVKTWRQEGEDDETLWRRHDAELTRVYGPDAVIMSGQIFE